MTGTAPRVRIPTAAIGALALLVIGTLTLAPTVSTALAQQRRIADLQRTVAGQERDLATLKAQRARWDDPAYVRAQAGSRLFYVLPGTASYRVVDDPGTPAPKATPQPAHPAWTTVLLHSLVDAGTTTATTSGLDDGR